MSYVSRVGMSSTLINLWRVPAKREEIKGVRYSYRGMKMKEEHIVPLSRQAMILLSQLKQISGDKELLFRVIMTQLRL